MARLKSDAPFDQKKYNQKWSTENMATISGRYKKEFVQSFRDACAKLGIKQSDVYRDAMQSIIDKAAELQ